MKAWYLDSTDAPLRLAERPDPQPRPGGAVVRMLAVQVPAYTRVLVAGGRGGLATPTVLGVGGIGRVEAVGAGVFSVRSGDVVAATGLLASGRVAEPEEVLTGWTGIGGRGTATATTDAMRATWHDGTFAERALLPAAALVALPGAEAYADLGRLAFLPWLTVAAGGVERSGLRAGDRVVVTGASGQLGGATVLLALAGGAARVAAYGRNAASLQALAELDPRVVPVASAGDRGADAVALRDALGSDADVVVDALGPAPTPDMTMAAYDVLRTDATMVLVGGVRQPLPVPYADLMHRRLTLRGSWMATPETAYAVWRQVEAGLLRLDALRVTTVGLDDPADALARAEAVRGLEIVALLP